MGVRTPDGSGGTGTGTTAVDFSDLPWVDVTQAPYNVKADGTDATPGLDAAADALAAFGGGTLLLPFGTITIATPWGHAPIQTSLRILGRGIGGTQVKNTVTGAGLRMWSFGNLAHLAIEEILFIDDGAARPESVVSAGFNVQGFAVRRCGFLSLHGVSSVLNLEAWSNSFRDSFVWGGNTTSQGVVVAGFGGAFIESVWFFDSGVNSAPAFIAFADVTRAEQYGANGNGALIVENCNFDESGTKLFKCNPTDGNKASRIVFRNCQSLNNTIQSAVEIHHARDVLFDRCAMTVRTQTRSFELYDCDRVEIRDHRTISPAPVGAQEGLAMMSADNQCGLVRIVDSDMDYLASDAADTIVEQAGIVKHVRKANGNIAIESFVKADATLGQVAQHTAGDAAGLAVGIAEDAAQPAFTAFAAPVAADLTNHVSAFAIGLFGVDFGQGQIIFKFYNDGIDPGDGLSVFGIDYSTGLQADIATNIAAAINACYAVRSVGPYNDFFFQATAVGTFVTVKSNANGEEFNTFWSVSGDLLGKTIDRHSLKGGRKRLRIVEKHGDRSHIYTDGTGVVAVGDALTPAGAAKDGQALKIAPGAGNYAARALEAAAAVSTRIAVIFEKGAA